MKTDTVPPIIGFAMIGARMRYTPTLAITPYVVLPGV